MTNGVSDEQNAFDEEREYLRSVSDGDNDRTLQMDRRTTAIICGGKPNHEHNNDWVSIETFDGEFFTGPKEELQNVKRRRMESVACSICGSSAFARDVYYGLE